jgi:hypothetical protein
MTDIDFTIVAYIIGVISGLLTSWLFRKLNNDEY